MTNLHCLLGILVKSLSLCLKYLGIRFKKVFSLHPFSSGHGPHHNTNINVQECLGYIISSDNLYRNNSTNVTTALSVYIHRKIYDEDNHYDGGGDDVYDNDDDCYDEDDHYDGGGDDDENDDDYYDENDHYDGGGDDDYDNDDDYYDEDDDNNDGVMRMTENVITPAT